jgi:flagellar protein FliO/FliZ
MSIALSMLARAPLASVPDINGWLTRRLQSRQLIGGRRLRCIESMPISARERVLLIEADGKRLLVGVGAGGVRALHVYEGSAPIVETQSPVAITPFAELLGRMGRKS